MHLNELLSQLQGVKQTGNQYVARCPVPTHGKGNGDKNQSLSIGLKSNNILLKCHAGCSTESIVSALGIEIKDLFDEEKTNGSNTKPKRDIIAVYDYKDLNGCIVHSTIRYDPKGFSQRRPDLENSDKFIWKDVFKGITSIIYNLGAVTTAIKEKQPILVVEGEKDCDNLAKYGFVATTCPMGAGSWKNHHSVFLTNGSIYIISDNDEVGYKHSTDVANSLVGKAEKIFLIDLRSVLTDMPTGGDVSDFIEAMPNEKKASAIAELLENATPFTQDKKEPSEKKSKENKQDGKVSQSEQLLILLESMNIKFFHDEIKELYAAVPVDRHIEIRAINSQIFEIWLNGLFYKEVGKPISKDAVKQAFAVISAKALYDNPDPVKLSTRVAGSDNAFWYDLTSKDWQVLKITKDGWGIADNPPILFTRYRHQKRQIVPISGGDINKILNYVNLGGNETLFLCWLVSCFVPDIPHAMPVIYGEKGAAKSTTSSLLKNLIDPSALDTLTLQNDQRSLAVNLLQHWFLPFDNVSYVNEEISDTLCRAITGGSILQRKLHTNFDEAILTFQRCLAINGINNVATRSDLLDRAILLELVRIADVNRRELAEIQANFEADQPSILGGIFDTLSKAMSIYPTVKLQCLPRMADFAKWGYAIGEALGVGLGQVFIDEYSANRIQQNEEIINNDPVLTLVVEFMRGKNEWYGLHSELYKKLEEIAEDFTINTRDKYFPKDATRLSMKLRGNKSNLENAGIAYIPPNADTRKNDGRYLSLKRINTASPELQRHETAERVALNGDTKNDAKYKVNNSDTIASHQQSLFSEGYDANKTGDAKKLALKENWDSVLKDELPDGW